MLDGALEQRTAPELRRQLLEAVGADPDADLPVATDPSGDGLRLAYRAMILRIAARDLCAPEPIEAMPQVADELSDLADATLEAALAIGRAKVGENALQTRLAVVGLGKCGAQELNYVSDVDVLFVAESALDSEGEPLLAKRRGDHRGHPDGRRADPDLLGPHQGRHDLGGRREPAARGTLGPAGPHPGQPPDLLPEVGEDLGVPGHAQGAAERGRPRAGPGLRRHGRAAGLERPPNGRTSSPTPRRCASGSSRTSPPGTPAGSSSSARADCATSSSRCRSSSSCTAEPTSGSAVAPTLEALRQLIDGGYVGRDDGKGFGLAYQFLRTLEHRIQLFRLRRTHVLPRPRRISAARAGRSGYADPAKQLLAIWRSCSGQVRRLHERLFYSPLLDAVARIPTNELRLTTQAAQDRLKALGYADPQASLRHIAALSQGMTRQAEIQRQLLPAMLGWFASAPNPDAGLLAFRQVSEALGATPWYLRALRDEGMMAERLARILASSRYAVELLKRAPQTVQMLADDAELAPRPLAELDSEMQAAAGRQKDPVAGIEAIRAIRRRELFRVAAGDLLGLNDVFAVGEALSDLASATIDATLAVVRHASEADVVPEIAVIAMGRWGGRELSYASDADAMFVMDDGGPARGTAPRSPGR